MIKIMADSTCDLSNEVLEKYDISVAPLTINIDGKIYRDRVDIRPSEFYGMMGSITRSFQRQVCQASAEYLKIMKTGR